ncbi:MAG: PorT family protein [Saprospirales bacterium]|nr:MAG: PorT family protein [Saprospirales bacterium]
MTNFKVLGSVLFFLLSFSIDDTSAQSEKSTYFGFKGGLNHSDIVGVNNFNEYTGYLGYELYAAFFADTKINDRWHFQNELLFSWTDEYHFIEVPLHIKYKVFEKWFLFVGPKLDFLLDNSNDGGYFEAYYRFQNFGVSVDTGIQYYFGSRFLAEGRFSRGFSPHVNDLLLDIYEGKRNTYRLGLGVIF